MDFDSYLETNLLRPVLPGILVRRLAEALSHTNDNSTFFKAHFIH
jgi:hypothetical protein